MTDKKKLSKAEMEELAEKIKMLLMFCAQLLPYKEDIKECFEHCEDRASTTMAAAPLLGAFGKDYEELHLNAKLEGSRAKAIYDLLQVLEDTEIEREKFTEQEKLKQTNLYELMQHLS